MIWIIPRQHFLTGCQVSFPQGRQMQGLLWRQTGYCEDGGVTAKIVVTVKIRGFFFLFFFFFFFFSRCRGCSEGTGIVMKMQDLCEDSIIVKICGLPQRWKGDTWVTVKIYGWVEENWGSLSRHRHYYRDVRVTMNITGVSYCDHYRGELLWTLQGWVTVNIMGLDLLWTL